MGRLPARPSMCEAIGCRAAVLETEVFCARHFAMVSTDLQKLLGKYARPRRLVTAVLEKHIAMAVHEILYFETEGHGVPRDAGFEFNDAGERQAPHGHE